MQHCLHLKVKSLHLGSERNRNFPCVTGEAKCPLLIIDKQASSKLALFHNHVSCGSGHLIPCCCWIDIVTKSRHADFSGGRKLEEVQRCHCGCVGFF